MGTIAFIFFLVSLASSQNQMSLRTGIAELQLGSLSLAAYNIVFSKDLPDSIYNSMVAVSHVTQLALTNGLIANSMCSNTWQTGMGCTITANSDNQNNIVYISYIASDVSSFVVGTYVHTFYLQGGSTSISQILTFQPQLDSNYFSLSNVLFIQFFPLISGISSIDSDFSLTMESIPPNMYTLEISLQVTITQMHATEVTVYFGYMVYDMNKITISQLQGQRLVPQSIPDGYIFGIGRIFSSNQPNRLLQSVPLKERKSLSSSIPYIKASTPSTLVYPLIVNRTRTSNKTSKNSSALSLRLPKGLSSKSLTPAIQSSLAHALRSAPNQVRLTPRKVNYALFDALMQPDGVIDVNASGLASLRQAGVVPNTAKSLEGINPQMFNTLFSTNGFIVLTSADDIDQIYYNQVNPVQNLQPQTASVYYRSSVTNVQEKPAVCNGILFGTLQRVDYVQKKMVQQCINCPSRSYFNLAIRACSCFAGLIFDPIQNICGCPIGLQFDTVSNTCKCPFGMELDTVTNSCNCPNGMIFDPSRNICGCPNGFELDPNRNVCDCPNGMQFDYRNNICSCPNYMNFDYSTSTCICIYGMRLNPATNTCECPQGLQFYPDRNSCDCPYGMKMDPTSNACGCSTGFSYNRATNSCICPRGLYLDPIGNICGCPHGMEMDYERGVCRAAAPLN